MTFSDILFTIIYLLTVPVEDTYFVCIFYNIDVFLFSNKQIHFKHVLPFYDVIISVLQLSKLKQV